nr:hypothetical protein [Vibrio cyclitrophicus]
MSLPDQPKATASSGGWFDSILEGAGELVGGAVDVVGILAAICLVSRWITS